MSIGPDLLGKKFPPCSGFLPMTAGRLPAYACDKDRTRDGLRKGTRRWLASRAIERTGSPFTD
jgi:hypothetical protein